jgi:hypothetical protein
MRLHARYLPPLGPLSQPKGETVTKTTQVYKFLKKPSGPALLQVLLDRDPSRAVARSTGARCGEMNRWPRWPRPVARPPASGRQLAIQTLPGCAEGRIHLRRPSVSRRVTSVKLVEIRRRFEVAIVQAAWGGSWRCSAPAAGDVISTIASSCM